MTRAVKSRLSTKKGNSLMKNGMLAAALAGFAAEPAACGSANTFSEPSSSRVPKTAVTNVFVIGVLPATQETETDT